MADHFDVFISDSTFLPVLEDCSRTQCKENLLFFAHPISVFKPAMFDRHLLVYPNISAEFSDWIWSDWDLLFSERKTFGDPNGIVFNLIGLPVKFRRTTFCSYRNACICI